MTDELKSFATLKTALTAAMKMDGDLEGFTKKLPDIVVGGKTLKPLVIYRGDSVMKSVEDIEKATSLSLVYQADNGDIRVQLSRSDAAYVSGWLDNRGVVGGNTLVNQSFDRQVEKLCDFISAKSLPPEKKVEFIEAFNRATGGSLTVDTIKKSTLEREILKNTPNRSSDDLQKMLGEIAGELPSGHPFKSYNYKTDIISNFKEVIETTPALKRALRISALELPALEGVKLAAEHASNAALPNLGVTRIVS